MEKLKGYKGLINGKYAIVCGFKPDNMVIEEEYYVLRAGVGKILKKGDENFDSVILKENESENDYTEIDAPAEVNYD